MSVRLSTLPLRAALVVFFASLFLSLLTGCSKEALGPWSAPMIPTTGGAALRTLPAAEPSALQRERAMDSMITQHDPQPVLKGAANDSAGEMDTLFERAMLERATRGTPHRARSGFAPSL